MSEAAVRRESKAATKALELAANLGAAKRRIDELEQAISLYVDIRREINQRSVSGGGRGMTAKEAEKWAATSAMAYQQLEVIAAAIDARHGGSTAVDKYGDVLKRLADDRKEH